MTSGHNPSFQVVALGGSAGGLEAFIAFFDALNRLEVTPDWAIIVLLHLPPNHDSALAEILRNHTRLPVEEIVDGVVVAPAHVYVLPPGHSAETRDGRLHLRRRADGGRHHPVDDIFASIGREFRERAVAIVCSGTGSNGSAGIPAVREAGGLVLAQDPASAACDEMPRRAIGTRMVDSVLPVGEMPDVIQRAGASLGGQGASPPTADGVDGAAPALPDAAAQDALSRILETIRAEGAIDFRPYRPGTLERRITRRINIRRCADIAEYADLIRSEREEIDALVDDLLISVTGFFRDPPAWDVFEERVAAPLLAGHDPARPVRAWVAGCATGEEAYSLAMVLLEKGRRRRDPLQFEIFATDLSARALVRAREGVYPAAAIEHLPESRRSRWFHLRDDTATVRQDLRETIIFAQHNLLQDPPFSQIDIITCRNMLIYIEPNVQKKLVRLFHFALREGGVLFLGSAENIGDAGRLFQTVDSGWRIYRRQGPTRHDLVDFPVVRDRPARPGSAVPANVKPPQRREGRVELAMRALVDRHAPPAILIDGRFDVLWYHGAVEPYLRPRTGEPTQNLVAVARAGIALELRQLVEAAQRAGAPRSVYLRLGPDVGSLAVHVEAAPVSRELGEELTLISFLDGPASAIRADDASLPVDVARAEAEKAILQEELARTILLYDRDREELATYNEEIVSGNEELRAANEELETSREDLQSLNEELSTVNSQLQAKLSELQERNDDISNLLQNIQDITLFLDGNLCIRWYSPGMERLFAVRNADLQRPVTDLQRHFDDPAFVEDCKEVLRTLVPSERHVTADDGRALLRRAAPYRTVEDRIGGVVVTFTDVTEIQLARHYAESIVETTPVPFLVLDPDLKVVSANPAFYRTFHFEAEDTEGHLLYAIGDGQWNLPELRQLLSDILPSDITLDGYVVDHRFRDVGRKVISVSARRLDHLDLILLALEDMTDRQLAVEQKAIVANELSHRVKNALAIVRSLANRTLERSEKLEDFRAAFMGRLDAYARAHASLLSQDWRPGELGDVVRNALDSHVVDQDRFELEGPAVPLSTRQSLSLSLVLHELATNSVKHGALSSPSGRVQLRWSIPAEGTVQIEWRELDGPPVNAPGTQGFGSMLIKGLMDYDLGGTAEIDYAATGLVCTVSFPAQAVADGGPAALQDLRP